MKRVITICLLALLIVPMVFAADVAKLNPKEDFKLEVVSRYNMPLTPRAKAMGGAGIAMPGRADAFFMNPAGLAKRGAVLISADATIYHPYDMLKPGKDGKSLIDNIVDATQIQDEEKKQAALMGAIDPVLNMIKAGPGKLMEVNADVAFDIAGFAFGAHVNDALHTYGTGLGGVDSALFDELNVQANVGLGFRIKPWDNVWFDLGANFRPTYKAYSQAIGAGEVVGAIKPANPDDPDAPAPDPATYFLEKIPLAAGYALPVDVGLNISTPWFSVGVVGRNINGGYSMKTFENINSFYQEKNFLNAFKGEPEFKIVTPWTLDAGIGLCWNNPIFKPTFVADVRDIMGLANAEKLDGRTFMEHLNLGAEIRLLSILDVRAGLNQGYMSVGAGLDLVIAKVDVAYYWQEFGEKLGDYGLDALSVRVNIGFDR